MEHYLQKIVLAKTPKIAITADEFSSLVKSRDVLSHALSIEDQYSIVLANYTDYEKCLLSVTTDRMIRGSPDYSDFHRDRMLLNVRLVNLLTATRLYIDHLVQHAKACVPDASKIKQYIRDLKTEQANLHVEFQFMEAFRNYVQHRGLPVHWIEHGARLTSTEEDAWLECSLQAWADKSVLNSDRKIDKALLDRLPEKLNLKSATRIYVECISNLHSAVRKRISPHVANARSDIEKAIDLYRSEYSHTLVGLNAIRSNDGKVVLSIPLLLDWDDVRIALQGNNLAPIVKLHRRYATGKVKEDKSSK